MSTESWNPLSEADAVKMTKEQNSFCKRLSDASKKVISTRQKQIFKFGRLLSEEFFLLQYISLGATREGCLQGDPLMC